MIISPMLVTVLAVNSLSADPLVAAGVPFGFLAPSPSYAPEEMVFQITLGYGDSSNSIGQGLWHSAPGFVDLSNDPNLPGFLSMAANGIPNTPQFTVTDLHGLQSVYFLPGWEGLLYGRWPNPDLAPLTITGVRLEVVGVGELTPGNPGIAVRYDFFGVPEPSTLGLLLVATLALRRRRSLAFR